jgi:hypothetical protein
LYQVLSFPQKQNTHKRALILESANLYAFDIKALVIDAPTTTADNDTAGVGILPVKNGRCQVIKGIEWGEDV